METLEDVKQKVLIVDDGDGVQDAVDMIKEGGYEAELISKAESIGICQNPSDIWKTPFNQEKQCDGSHTCEGDCECKNTEMTGDKAKEILLEKMYGNKKLEQIVHEAKGNKRLHGEEWHVYKLRRDVERKAINWYLKQGTMKWNSAEKGPASAAFL